MTEGEKVMGGEGREKEKMRGEKKCNP